MHDLSRFRGPLTLTSLCALFALLLAAQARAVQAAVQSTRVPVIDSVPPRGGPCQVFGKVVDEQGRALQGTEVRLQSAGAWNKDNDARRLPGSWNQHGWIVLSDAQGEFRFEVPTPTAAGTSLQVTGGPLQEQVYLTFSGIGESPPRLQAGRRDVGTLRLLDAGCLSGRILDDAGHGLEGVHVFATQGEKPPQSQTASSAADGSFTLPHVPRGSLNVRATHARYLESVLENVSANPGVRVERLELRMSLAPTLSGVVVDEEGKALAGVKLVARADGPSPVAQDESSTDGRFCLPIHRDLPQSLVASLDGFEPAAGDSDRTRYAPGTNDLRLVLHRIGTRRFQLVDARTGLPIESFGYTLNYPPLPGVIACGQAVQGDTEAHTSGIIRIQAPRGAASVNFVATGYLPAAAPIEASFGADSITKVALQPLGGLRGRLLVRGAPVANCELRWTIGSMAANQDGRRTFETGYSEQIVLTDPQGSFCTPLFNPGGFVRLRARDARGWVLEGEPIELDNSVRDLGDLELVEAASIVGEVLVPGGRSAAGLRVSLDSDMQHEPCITDALGRFRFPCVTSGNHQLRVDGVPGELLNCRSIPVELRRGEARRMVIDATSMGTCPLSLLVQINGQPAADTEVLLDFPERSNPAGGVLARNAAGELVERYSLGRTDVNGRIECFAPARGMGQWLLRTSWLPIEHPGPRVSFEIDRRMDASVCFELASIQVRYQPARFGATRFGVSATLRENAGKRSLRTLLAEHHASTSGKVEFHSVPAGESELSIDFVKMEDMPAPGAAFPVLASLRQKVNLARGELLVLDLP